MRLSESPMKIKMLTEMNGSDNVRNALRSLVDRCIWENTIEILER